MMQRLTSHLVFLGLLCLACAAQAALDIQSWTLNNGAKVLFVESRSIPVVDVAVEFDAGRMDEGKAGARHACRRGTGTRAHANRSTNL